MIDQFKSFPFTWQTAEILTVPEHIPQVDLSVKACTSQNITVGTKLTAEHLCCMATEINSVNLAFVIKYNSG